MANDFSGDPNCVALWKFDNNPNDAKGENDLTPVNSPAYDSGDKKEGTHCIDFESASNQYCTIADGDLDAGFPGKNGGGESSFSICFWAKPETLGSYDAFISKTSAIGNITFIVYYNGSSGKIVFEVGYNGGANSSLATFDTALSTGKWYHVAVVFDASDNSARIRIWDDDAGALLDSNKEFSIAGDMSPTNSPLEVGRFLSNNAYCLDGKIDEVVIFKDVLTDDEIDQIRSGTYGTATEKESSDTGTGTDTVEWLQTPQAKTSSDNGTGVEDYAAGATIDGSESGSAIEALIARLLADGESGGAVEASSLETEELKDLFDSQPAEGADRLVAKIEIPVKGGGMRLWT